MNVSKGSRVRLPDGRYGTITYIFSEHPFAGDVSIKVDGKEERELWSTEEIMVVSEAGASGRVEA